MIQIGLDFHHAKPMPDKLELFHFVILKKAQGEAWDDPKFNERAKIIHDMGLDVEAYSYFETEDHHLPEEQAENLVQGMPVYIKRAWVDVEAFGNVPNGNEAEYLWLTLEHANKFLPTGVYSSPGEWNKVMEQHPSNIEFMKTHDFSKFAIWVANWRTRQPSPGDRVTYPTPWKGKQYDTWQYGVFPINGERFDHNLRVVEGEATPSAENADLHTLENELNQQWDYIQNNLLPRVEALEAGTGIIIGKPLPPPPDTEPEPVQQGKRRIATHKLIAFRKHKYTPNDNNPAGGRWEMRVLHKFAFQRDPLKPGGIIYVVKEPKNTFMGGKIHALVTSCDDAPGLVGHYIIYDKTRG